MFYIIVFPFPSESLNIELKVESLKFKVEFWNFQTSYKVGLTTKAGVLTNLPGCVGAWGRRIPLESDLGEASSAFW